MVFKSYQEPVKGVEHFLMFDIFLLSSQDTSDSFLAYVHFGCSIVIVTIIL